MNFRTFLSVLLATFVASAAHADADFCAIARQPGEPQVPGLKIVYLTKLGNPADALPWSYILVHQTEGPAGSARGGANEQAKRPGRRGVMLWVETDGTVYWATPENVVTLQGDGANRNDNKYVDNTKTYRKVVAANSIGVEFAGNFPDVTRPATPEQVKAWPILMRFLQERYGIASENIYAHNWIDFKDARYCEGCELAKLARDIAYVPSKGGPCRFSPKP
jgi:hypothetical protein